MHSLAALVRLPLFPVLLCSAGSLYAQQLQPSERLQSDGTRWEGALSPIRVEPRLGDRADRPGKPAAPRTPDPAAALVFAAQAYLPPATERLDPLLAAWPSARGFDGRGADEVYAYLLPALELHSARVQELQDLGVRWIGRHGAHAYRVALPTADLASIAAHPSVRWIGFARPAQKLAPALAGPASAGLGLDLDVWISLAEGAAPADLYAHPVGAVALHERNAAQATPMASQSAGLRWSNRGWQAQALEALGVTLQSYARGAAAFHARVPASSLAQVLALDFVSRVEPALALQSFHDESIPLIGADQTRAFYSGTSVGTAAVAMIDSGMWITHEALTHAYAISHDLVGSGLFMDEEGHGTGVAHTILGQPPVYNSEHRGVAPGLGSAPDRRFRFVRVASGLAPDPTPPDYELFFDLLSTPYADPNNFVSPVPHIVNISNGIDGSLEPPTGTNIFARMLDAAVYEQDQLAVVAAGNSGPAAGSILEPAAAKNAFAVGGVTLSTAPGTVSLSSSRGPTVDGRFKPNVVAPNRADWAQSGTSATYGQAVGTSVAAPHVSGVAAQLVDHFPALAYRPARLAALLMATAFPFGDELLDSNATSLNHYGLGRVDALRAHGLDSASNWVNDYVELAAGDGASADFVIEKTCRRLVVVLHYIEPAGLPGADRAILNDYDLWVDVEPLSSALDEGEFKSLSVVDNTEFVVIDNPAAGTWRWKANPYDAMPLLGGTVKIGVTMHRLLSMTAQTSLVISSPDTYLRPGDMGGLFATVSNSGRIASAQFAQLTTVKNAGLGFAFGYQLDGAEAIYHTNNSKGFAAVLGNIGGGHQRTADWHVSWSDEGTYLTGLHVDGDNTSSQTQALWFTVDGTPPGMATLFVSSTHAPNVWSKTASVALQWTAPVDNLSGIDGYVLANSTSAPALPAPPKTLGAVTSATVSLSSSAAGQYFALRAVDKCSNWSTLFAQAGPFKIDTVLPTAMLSGPSTTSLTNVTLTITAADTHSGLDRMRFRVNNGAWSAWQLFATTKAFTFAPNSQNLVTVEVRDKALNSRTANKTVVVL